MSILKRLFGIRKAGKAQEEVKIDYEVADLKKRYILDYDMRSWEVKDTMIYSWDGGFKTYEYTISDGTEKQYLNYENDDDNLSIYVDGSIQEIWPEATQLMRNGSKLADMTFHYDGEKYHFKGQGSASVKSSSESFNMKNWLFETASKDHLVSFNIYEDDSVDAYIGKPIKSFEISNILPR